MWAWAPDDLSITHTVKYLGPGPQENAAIYPRTQENKTRHFT